MSREHYCIELTSNEEKTNSEKLVVFLDHIVALWPQKDETCKIQTREQNFHVKESLATIMTRSRGYGLITKAE